jgi:hypothetical protein
LACGFGWTAGIGVEWAFAYNVSARVEYDFIGLQNQSITVPAGSAFAGDTINFNNRNISLQFAHREFELQIRWWMVVSRTCRERQTDHPSPFVGA